MISLNAQIILFVLLVYSLAMITKINLSATIPALDKDLECVYDYFA